MITCKFHCPVYSIPDLGVLFMTIGIPYFACITASIAVHIQKGLVVLQFRLRCSEGWPEILYVAVGFVLIILLPSLTFSVVEGLLTRRSANVFKNFAAKKRFLFAFQDGACWTAFTFPSSRFRQLGLGILFPATTHP